MGEALLSATHEFVERYRSDLDEQDPATLHSAAEAITAWQTSRLDPVSVIHGDYRLDNLLFHPGDHRVTAVDWQTAAIGPPLRDVAYCLGRAGTPTSGRPTKTTQRRVATPACYIGGSPTTRWMPAGMTTDWGSSRDR